MNLRNSFISNIWGGLIGLLCAGIILLILWFAAFIVAFGNPGPFAEAYLTVAAILLSGIMPIIILAAGYLGGAYVIGR